MGQWSILAVGCMLPSNLGFMEKQYQKVTWTRLKSTCCDLNVSYKSSYVEARRAGSHGGH
jgi:hypothetical protein